MQNFKENNAYFDIIITEKINFYNLFDSSLMN